MDMKKLHKIVTGERKDGKVKPGVRDMGDDYQEVTKLMGGWCNGKKALKLTNHTKS